MDLNDMVTEETPITVPKDRNQPLVLLQIRRRQCQEEDNLTVIDDLSGDPSFNHVRDSTPPMSRPPKVSITYIKPAARLDFKTPQTSLS